MIYENDPLPLHHLKFMLCCGEKYNWKLLVCACASELVGRVSLQVLLDYARKI